MYRSCLLLLVALLLALPGRSQDGPAPLLQVVKLGGASRPAPAIPAPVRIRAAARPTAAPVAINVVSGTAFNSGIVPVGDLQYTVTSPNTISTATITLPANSNTKGTLYQYNGGASVGPTMTPGASTTYNFVTYPYLAFSPATGFSGPYTFTYTVTDNTTAVSNVATYTIYVGGPSAKAQTSEILLSSFAATTLSLPLVGTPDAATSNAVTGFVIQSLPSASAGVLALNGTAVAVNQVIVLADAAKLTFDPAAGFFGTAVFTYSARDNAGSIGGPAGYGIPVGNGACSSGSATTQRSLLDFTTRAIAENFATANTITVDGVTITASPAAYPFTAGTGTVNSFDVRDLNGLPGKGLVWQENYSTGSTKSSTATFTFSQAVSNFTMTLGDLDRNVSTNADAEYIDRIVFNAYDINGNLITLPSSSVSTGPLNTYNGNNTVTATGNFTSDPSNNVTITFPQAITRLTMTYSNQTANADAGFQFVSIPQFAWCNPAASAAVQTTLSGPATIPAGQSVTYTATSINTGGLTAMGNVVTISLPDKPAAGNVTVTNGTYNASTGLVTFNAQDLAAGATVTNTVTFIAQASPTTVSGTAASTSSTFDADASDNNGTAPNATVTTTVLPVADVTTTVTPSQAVAVAGQAFSFAVTYTNNGPSTAPGFSQALQLPAGLGTSNVTFSNLPAGVTAAYNNVTGVVSFTGVPATLANGASQSLTVNIADVPSGLASLSVKSTVGTSASQGADTAPNTVTTTVPVATPTDLSTSLSGPTSATQGNEVTLNVTTTNNGPATGYNVVQTVQLATGLSNVFVSNNGTYNSGTGVVTFPALSSLGSGQTATNYVSFKAPATAFTPTATVTPNTTATGDTNPANNTAALNGLSGGSIAINAATGSVANLYNTISSSAQTVSAGANVTLTVVTGNAGPATAYNVSETVQLQPGLSGLLINGAAATGPAVGNEVPYANGNKYNTQTGVVTFAPLTSLASAGTASNTLTFATPTTTSWQLLATAAVSSTSATAAQVTTDPVPADNIASTKITVTQTNADLAATITGPASVVDGQPVTYTATFTNNGASAASQAVATVQLPAGLSGVSLSQGTYDATTGVVTFPTVASAAPGTALSYTISYTPPTTGTYNASANYTSSSPDATPANNTASISTSVLPSADLAVRLNAPTTAATGGAVTYVAETTNNGPQTATSVVTTIQLPVGLALASVTSSGGTYSATTGLVTFNTASLVSGASVSNFATYTNASATTFTGQAVVSSATSDPNSGNNTSNTSTTITTTTGVTTVDIFTTLTSPTATPVAPGSPVTLTVGFDNNNSSGTLNNIVEALYLPPGTVVSTVDGVAPATTPGAGVTSYNSTTGVLIFANNSLGKNGNISYSVVLTAPATGASFSAVSVVAVPYAETTITNNRVLLTIPLSQPAAPTTYDEQTTLAGPASALPGAAVTYTVQTVNNGPANSGTVTQSVSFPAGTVITNNGGGTVSTTGGITTITFPAFSAQAPGAGSAVVKSFTVTMPASGSLVVNASVTATGETGTAANNTASATTTSANQAPVAASTINALMIPRGNTAGPQLISPLTATDADGTIAGYQLTSIPNAATQGVLFYDNGGTYTAITSATQALTPAQALTLKFDPVSTFVGNVFFAYTAIDNLGSVSTPVLYTIQVGQDNAALYGTTPVKGGTTANGLTKYAANDVIAFVTDVNAARYNSTGQLYDATTGALASGAANGLATTGTNATTDAAGTTLLAAQGLVLNAATGQITVSNPKLLTAGTYTVNITTTDLYGGVTTQPVTFTIGDRPLPVELTAFAATAKNLDALLTWSTASEKNNDHFSVERSLNGTDFVKIDEVKGQGTSTSATDYALTDAGIGAKASSLVYYRLKQVDADGTSSYSPVRSVRFGKVVPAIALFPNPATTATNLDLTALPAGSYQVSVLDATGRVVLTTTLDAGLAHALPLNTIASGSYTLLVRGANGGQVVNLTKRLIKE